jgi:predicted metalloprotease
MQQRKDLEIVALKQQYESRLQAAAAASRDSIQPQIQQQTQYKISEHRNSVQRMETVPESRSQASWSFNQKEIPNMA